MNCAKVTLPLVVAPFLLLAVEPSAKDTIRTEANPPWKPRRTYEVTSRYEMKLCDVVLDIRLFQKEHRVWGFLWTVDEKEKQHATSRPFSCEYNCYLNYRTFGADTTNRNNGSVFRAYDSANITFQPVGEDGRLILVDANPSWFRSLFFDPKTKMYSKEDVKERLKDADFFFREIFTTGGRFLDTDSWYFLSWKERDALKPTRNKHMNIFKKGRLALPRPDALEGLGRQGRAQIEMGLIGDGPSKGWYRVLSDDLGHQVAQAEAKLMTYCIYGQEETRNLGDVWTIDAETLESFFPLQSKGRKPFTFSGGVLVLTVKSVKDGIVTVESLPRGEVKGSTVDTDLKITPNTDGSEFKPSFEIHMADTRHNLVRFSIDSLLEVCNYAEMWLLLEHYAGALPNVEQMALTEVNPKKQRLDAHIDDGRIELHARISTKVGEME